MEVEAPLLPPKQGQNDEPVETTAETTLPVFEKPQNVMKHRPAPAYDVHKKKDEDENEDEEDTEESDDDDDDASDDETDDDIVEEEDDDDDDDDDDESGTDGGEEDENELIYEETKNNPQQLVDPNLLRLKKDEDKNKKKKITPSGPEKIDRSPWQQMVDFLIHGAKEAQIKNGDLPTKPRLSDRILLGLGLKSIKEDILLAEGAEKFWKLKSKGVNANMSLVDTDRISKKIKKAEDKINLPRKQEEKRLTEQQRYKNHIERIMQQRREQNIRLQMEKQGELTRAVTDVNSKSTHINAKQHDIAQSQITAQKQIQEQIKQSATKQSEQQNKQKELTGLTAEINQLKTTASPKSGDKNVVEVPQLPKTSMATTKTEAEKQATPQAQEKKARKESMETAIVQSIQNNVQAQQQVNIQNNIQAQQQANIQNNIQAQQQANVQNNLQAQNQATMQNIQAQNQATMQNQMDARNAQQSMVIGKPLTREEQKQLAALVGIVLNTDTPKNNQNSKTPDSSSNNNTPTQEQVNEARDEASKAFSDTAKDAVGKAVATGTGQRVTYALAGAGEELKDATTTQSSQYHNNKGR